MWVGVLISCHDFEKKNAHPLKRLSSTILISFLSTATQSRYSVLETIGSSLLRIEPVRAGRDDAPYECIAENGVGDAVSSEATLTVYEGKLKRNRKKICSRTYRNKTFLC